MDRFLRFCLVGIFNTGVNYGVFLLLWSLGNIPYLVAGPIGFLSGAVPGYFLNRAWTFRSDINLGSGFWRYILVQLVSLGSHWCAQWIAGEVFGVPHGWTQLAGIVVSMFVNFTLLNLVVFRTPANTIT